MLQQIGAYDNNPTYKSLTKKFPCADIVIPLQKGAIDNKENEFYRNRNILEVKYYGNMEWQKRRDYGKRNNSELAIQRYKRILGNNASVVNVDAKPCFPPRIQAARHKPIDKAYQLRNNVIARVRELGMKKWKQKNNLQSSQSGRNSFFKIKKIFGDHAASRTFANQVIELALRCNILNKINSLGMPVSIRS